MQDITYCSHIDCYDKECPRHQSKAPKGKDISIADLNDDYCFIPTLGSNTSSRDKLLAAICKGTQNTIYKCDTVCKALCGQDGTCVYCAAIADAVEEVIR